MAKYYVESGNLRMVVHANDSRAAAIWAVHRSMSQIMPFLADESRQILNQLREPLRMKETIQTNEQGFDRLDGEIHDTFAVVTEWNRLVVALDRLQAEFSQEVSAV
jgi:hypothetical protein